MSTETLIIIGPIWFAFTVDEAIKMIIISPNQSCDI